MHVIYKYILVRDDHCVEPACIFYVRYIKYSFRKVLNPLSLKEKKKSANKKTAKQTQKQVHRNANLAAALNFLHFFETSLLESLPCLWMVSPLHATFCLYVSAPVWRGRGF